MVNEPTMLSTPSSGGMPRSRGKGLPVRFVVRMSGALQTEVAKAARRDGATAGAWVRRQLLDRVGLQSPEDARSGRPIRQLEADTIAVSAAIRELAAVHSALSLRDEAAAKVALHQARSLLIPLVVRRSSP